MLVARGRTCAHARMLMRTWQSGVPIPCELAQRADAHDNPRLGVRQSESALGVTCEGCHGHAWPRRGGTGQVVKLMQAASAPKTASNHSLQQGRQQHVHVCRPAWRSRRGQGYVAEVPSVVDTQQGSAGTTRRELPAPRFQHRLRQNSFHRCLSMHPIHKMLM